MNHHTNSRRLLRRREENNHPFVWAMHVAVVVSGGAMGYGLWMEFSAVTMSFFKYPINSIRVLKMFKRPRVFNVCVNSRLGVVYYIGH